MKLRIITMAEHCKYSESDEVYKRYKHKLYTAVFEPSQDDTGKDFSLDDSKYKWFSFAEMEKDPDIMKTNEDIVAFVKRNIKG